MNYYVDTCSDFVRVYSSWGKGVKGQVIFDQGIWDQPIDLPQTVPNENIKGYYMKASYVPFTNKHYAVLMSSADKAIDQRTFLVCRETREVKELRAGCGMWGLWINEEGLILITECEPNYFTYNVYGDELKKDLIPLPNNRTSQGFAGFNLFTDSVGIVKVGPFNLARYRTDGNWGVGLHTGSDQIIAWDVITGLIYLVASVKTQVGCTIIQHDDLTCTVSISLPEDSKTFFVHSSKFTEIIDEPLPAFNPDKYAHKLFLASYETYSTRYGITNRFIGNMAFPDKQYLPIVPVPTIMAWDTYDSKYVNTCLYYYIHCSGSGLDSGKEQYEFFNDKPEKPRILYLDSRTKWPIKLPSWINPRTTFPSIQMRRNKNESIPSFLDAMNLLASKVSQYKLPMVCDIGCYDRAGMLTENEILECFPVYDKIIRDYFTIGIMPFADMRPDGMVQYPILYDYIQLMYNAIPVRPNRLDAWALDPIQDGIQIKLGYEMPMFASSEITYLRSLLP